MAHNSDGGEEATRKPAADPAYRMPHIIAKKRDAGELSHGEINWFIKQMLEGNIDDSQIGALLMAMYLKGLSRQETSILTTAMRDSGEVMRWPDEWQGLVVDKHSTGGVGDKTSFPLAPALAACGMKVPMISGRGLGHTGGTLDKLESIPGYDVMVAMEKMTAILKDVGCCIVGQTSNLVPADKKLYATRDVTATVDDISLITASIVSKKAAESINALVLDVKFGNAAFMKTKDEGRQLARSLVSTSSDMGVKTVALLTDMNSPIGYTTGNALEVAEAIQCLQGAGPDDLKELVCHLGGHLLHINGTVNTVDEGMALIQGSLDDGSACEKFRAMLVAQGVQESVAERLCTTPIKCIDDVWSVLKRAEYTTDIPALESGYVQGIDAMAMGKVTFELGAGRSVAGADIDHAVGLRLKAKIGSKLEKGEDWIRVYHNTSPLSSNHIAILQAGLTIGPDEVKPSSRIHEVVHA